MNEWTAGLEELRNIVFEEVRRSLEEDGHCKHYEGTVSVTWPNYFERDDPKYTVSLDCYLIGPTRHYHWTAPSIEEALHRAIQDVRTWCADDGDWLETHWHRAREQEKADYQEFVRMVEQGEVWE